MMRWQRSAQHSTHSTARQDSSMGIAEDQGRVSRKRRLESRTVQDVQCVQYSAVPRGGASSAAASPPVAPMPPNAF